MNDTYLLGIISFVVIVILLTIYILTKKKDVKKPIVPTHKTKNSFESHTSKATVVEVKEQKTTDSQKSRVTHVHKRSVPQHGKITKKNFQEFAGHRILIAEDNIINQKVMIGLLEGTGIEYIIADDGQIVLDILEKDSNFTMILMDEHMPRMDGFQATRAIKSNKKYNHIVVIALSGDTAKDDVQKMKDAGMSEHLEKPLKIDALYDIFYAYTSTPPIQQINNIKSLDTEEGIRICGDNEEFYHEVLTDFVLNYKNSAHTLFGYVNSKSLQEADKLLLDIIGLTATLGAKPLNLITQDLKSLLKNSEKHDYTFSLQNYKTEFQKLVLTIQDYTKKALL